jgi:hypothetical protein
VMEGADEEISPLTGDEIIEVFSMMEGIDDEISSLTGDETNKVSCVMEGADEEITDEGSAEKTSEMSCNDLEKLSFVEEVGETELVTDWTELEKVLVDGELTEKEKNEAHEG